MSNEEFFHALMVALVTIEPPDLKKIDVKRAFLQDGESYWIGTVSFSSKGRYLSFHFSRWEVVLSKDRIDKEFTIESARKQYGCLHSFTHIYELLGELK